MEPVFETEMGKLFNGHALEVLRQMPDESVQCVVTSPPYWGLRDYGCDGQIGLEQTPEEYVSVLVSVFREARRVLKKDGTLWLNLGSSYSRDFMKGGSGPNGKHDFIPDYGTARRALSSYGKSPIRSPLLQRVPSCGNGDKGSQDSQGADRACLGSCDGPQGEIQNHRGCTVHNGQYASQGERQTSLTDHDTGHSDCVQEPLGFSLPGAQGSTMPQSSDLPSGASFLEGEASASPQEIQTSSVDVHQSADTSACTSGTSRMSPPLVVRTVGKESFFSACGKSSCKGIGNCGLCWASLAIPSLNVKPKDLVSIPQLVAFALQADGWWLRSDIIWSKPNPMPESVTDRPTKAHEYIFLLSKSERYFFDQEAVREPAAFSGPNSPQSIASPYGQGFTRRASWKGSQFHDGKNLEIHPNVGKNRKALRTDIESRHRSSIPGGQSMSANPGETRNIRTVWTLPTCPYPEAHFATFPPSIPERCIKAGSREGDTVLDPFSGAGTVGLVAEKLKRRWICAELSEKYCDLSRARIQKFLWGEDDPGQERLFPKQESFL